MHLASGEAGSNSEGAEHGCGLVRGVGETAGKEAGPKPRGLDRLLRIGRSGPSKGHRQGAGWHFGKMTLAAV